MLSAEKSESSDWGRFSVLRVCFLKENMSAFCVEMQHKALVFAALKDDCLAWVEKLCHNTFQVGPLTSAVHGNHDPAGNTCSPLSVTLSKHLSRVLVSVVWRKTRYMPLQTVKHSFCFTFFISILSTICVQLCPFGIEIYIYIFKASL